MSFDDCKKKSARTSKSRKHKIMKEKPIKESDIMYQDELVCILKPHIKKGIVVWSNYTQPPNTTSLCIEGLKTGKLLHEEGVEFGRVIHHPFIFFRAPYYSRQVYYSTLETEIMSSYGMIGENKVFIRVDPTRTSVFSSEIRDLHKRPMWYGKIDTIIQNSKKTLSDYLDIIRKNCFIEKNVDTHHKICYNLFSSEAVVFPKSVRTREMFDDYPINRCSEILVSIPHLTPNYFVLCT
jgi:hypothetical protein